MKELSAVLDAAADKEDPIIRDVARRACVLWACRCGDDNPAAQPTCEGCGSRAEDVCTPGCPDPTPDLGLEADDLCAHHGPDGEVCTRRAGHTGQQHVAGNGREVVAVWDPDDALCIDGSLGPATLTVVEVELGIELDPVHIGQRDAIRGDRAVLRNRTHRPGLCDVYAVFEREQRSRFWRQVTDELTARRAAGHGDARRRPRGQRAARPPPELTRPPSSRGRRPRESAHGTTKPGAPAQFRVKGPTQ